MVTGPYPHSGASRSSALVLRHLEELYGAQAMPADAIERMGRSDHWFGILPRLSDLPPEGAALVADFRSMAPDLRGRLLAFALQRQGAAVAQRDAAAAGRFVEIAERGRMSWSSDLHRMAVLAAADSDDHSIAGGVCFDEHPSPHGGALHLLFAEQPVAAADLVAAGEFFARADRPSWALHCLVSAASSAPTPEAAAGFAAAATNIAACDGDFGVAERVMAHFAATDTTVLLRESAPARALRQALFESDPVAAGATILGRLRNDSLNSEGAGEALAVFALVNLVGAREAAWEDFLQACADASAPLHPHVTAVASSIGSLNAPVRPHLDYTVANDGRGWSQVAGSVATILDALRSIRLMNSVAPTHRLARRVGNRLVRATESTHLSLMLSHIQHWKDLEATATIALEATDIVPIPVMRVATEATYAFAEAFQGDAQAARRRVDRILADPVLHRSYRLRAMVDSAVVMIEGPQGNYEQAIALLSTRQTDLLNLVSGPCGPMELFDFVDYALMLQEEAQAVARVEQFRRGLQRLRSERADFVVAACDAIIAARTTLSPAEELLVRAESLPFVYEAARLRLVYAERLRRARRTAKARRHLLRVQFDLVSVQAGAWLDRVQRELRACQREIAVRVADLTEQETRIAELAAAGRSNKEIAARLYLSPRTVGGHLYRIFPKLGITTRAQLRDALSVVTDADGEHSPTE